MLATRLLGGGGGGLNPYISLYLHLSPPISPYGGGAFLAEAEAAWPFLSAAALLFSPAASARALAPSPSAEARSAAPGRCREI